MSEMISFAITLDPGSKYQSTTTISACDAILAARSTIRSPGSGLYTVQRTLRSPNASVSAFASRRWLTGTSGGSIGATVGAPLGPFENTASWGGFEVTACRATGPVADVVEKRPCDRKSG